MTGNKSVGEHGVVTLDALTGLRFIAAMSIVISHLTGAGYRPFGIHYNLSVAGMPLFFTLSGFIIHYVYSASFTQSWRATTGEFAIARFSRLYPLFALLLLTSLLFTSLGSALSGSPWILLSYATMTASWWYWHVDGVSLIQLPFGLSWSISTEVFFYVAYAAGLYRIAALRSLPGTIVIFGGFCVLAYAFVYLVIHERDTLETLARAVVPNFISMNPGEQFPNSFLRWLIYVSPYFHLLEFIAGVLTCHIFLLMRRHSATMSRGWREALGWAGVAWIAAGVTFTAYVSDIISSVPSSFVELVAVTNLMSMSFLLAPGCCAVILVLAAGRSSLQFVLAAPAIVLMGECSYSIYLAHPLLSQITYVAKENAYPLISYAVAIFFLLFFSHALYRGVEIPAKRFLRNWFGVQFVNSRLALDRGK